MPAETQEAERGRRLQEAEQPCNVQIAPGPDYDYKNFKVGTQWPKLHTCVILRGNTFNKE